MAGHHFVGTLIISIILNVSFEIVYSSPVDDPFGNNESLTIRASDELAGAPVSEITTDDEEVQNYARLGLQEISKTFEGSNEPILVGITSVTAQLVAGTLYELQIRVGTSDCPKGTKQNCQLLDDSEIQEYKVKAISQPWLGEDGLTIEVERIAGAISGGQSVKERKSRQYRRSSERPGGPRPISVDSENVQNYASLGIKELSKTFEGPNEPVLVEILSATSQIVAGTLYEIRIRAGTSDCPKGTKQNCQLLVDSEIQEYEVKATSQPWLGEDGLTIRVERIAGAISDEQSVKERKIRRYGRSSERPGGPRPISVDSENVQNYASLGIKELSKTFEGPNEPVLVEILSATSQIVAGTLYEIRIRAGTSDCPKGTKQNCQLLVDSEIQEYEVKATSQPWLGEDGLTIRVERIAGAISDEQSVKERKIRRYGRSSERPGGPRPISVDSENVQNYASLGIKELSKTFEGPNEPVLVEILSATSQIVAGTLYEIRIRAGTSDCPKGTKQNCQLLVDSEIQEYEVKATSQPWLGEAGLTIRVEPILSSADQ